MPLGILFIRLRTFYTVSNGYFQDKNDLLVCVCVCVCRMCFTVNNINPLVFVVETQGINFSMLCGLT
jgi:hypothetical protein